MRQFSFLLVHVVSTGHKYCPTVEYSVLEDLLHTLKCLSAIPQYPSTRQFQSLDSLPRLNPHRSLGDLATHLAVRILLTFPKNAFPQSANFAVQSPLYISTHISWLQPSRCKIFLTSAAQVFYTYPGTLQCIYRHKISLPCPC